MKNYLTILLVGVSYQLLGMQECTTTHNYWEPKTNCVDSKSDLGEYILCMMNVSNHINGTIDIELSQDQYNVSEPIEINVDGLPENTTINIFGSNNSKPVIIMASSNKKWWVFNLGEGSKYLNKPLEPCMPVTTSFHFKDLIVQESSFVRINQSLKDLIVKDCEFTGSTFIHNGVVSSNYDLFSYLEMEDSNIEDIENMPCHFTTNLNMLHYTLNYFEFVHNVASGSRILFMEYIYSDSAIVTDNIFSDVYESVYRNAFYSQKNLTFNRNEVYGIQEFPNQTEVTRYANVMMIHAEEDISVNGNTIFNVNGKTGNVFWSQMGNLTFKNNHCYNITSTKAIIEGKGLSYGYSYNISENVFDQTGGNAKVIEVKKIKILDTIERPLIIHKNQFLNCNNTILSLYSYGKSCYEIDGVEFTENLIYNYRSLHQFSDAAIFINRSATDIYIYGNCFFSSVANERPLYLVNLYKLFDVGVIDGVNIVGNFISYADNSLTQKGILKTLMYNYPDGSGSYMIPSKIDHITVNRNSISGAEVLARCELNPINNLSLKNNYMFEQPSGTQCESDENANLHYLIQECPIEYKDVNNRYNYIVDSRCAKEVRICEQEIEIAPIIHQGTGNDGSIFIQDNSNCGDIEYVWNDGSIKNSRVNLTGGEYCVLVSSVTCSECSRYFCFNIAGENCLDEGELDFDILYNPLINCDESSKAKIANENLSEFCQEKKSCGFIYDDKNYNGKIDEGEGLTGVILDITHSNGNSYEMVTTDEFGRYCEWTTPGQVSAFIDESSIPSGFINLIHEGPIRTQPDAKVEYFWSNGKKGNEISNLKSGQYCVTATVSYLKCHGCEVYKCFTIESDNPEIKVTELEKTNISCKDGEIDPGGIKINIQSNSNYNYEWSDEGLGLKRNFTIPGSYCITVWPIADYECKEYRCFDIGIDGDFSGCIDKEGRGFGYNNKKKDFSFRPNPTHDLIRWDYDSSIRIIQLVDLYGRVVIQINPSEKPLDLSQLTEGIYFLQIVHLDNTIHSEKVIKL